MQAPAMQPPMGTGGPIPDPRPMYEGMMTTPNIVPPSIGGAVVIPGKEVGGVWYGCTYTSPPYVIPGLGTIQKL